VYDEQIDVLSYSGRTGDERPAALILRGLRIDVTDIMDHWIEEGFKDRVRKRYFIVMASDGNIYRIYYDENTLKWFYTL
jgi:hypothetical protein